MRGAGAALLALAAGGCAARVPLQVPPSPSVVVPSRSIAVVAVERECRDIADLLASHLDGVPELDVRPDAETRLDLYGCAHSWARVPHRDDAAVGSALAVVALSEPDGVVAQVIGAGREEHRASGRSANAVRVPRAAEESLDAAVARDLVEQLTPAATTVRRRVYSAPAAGSARQYHNLAVDAEREGRLDDAVWWATQALERAPSSKRARYVNELERRLSRSKEILSRAP